MRAKLGAGQFERPGEYHSITEPGAVATGSIHAPFHEGQCLFSYELNAAARTRSTGAEAALPAWIDFMTGAIAVRPSLGGTSFQKPAGITTVRVDPETGYLAGPDCPRAEVVNVAMQFAPAVECYKHMRPDPALLSEDIGDEAWIDGSETAAATLAGSVQYEATDAADSTVSADPEYSEATKAHNRPTEKEVNQFGRPILVNNPVSPGAAARTLARTPMTELTGQQNLALPKHP